MLGRKARYLIALLFTLSSCSLVVIRGDGDAPHCKSVLGRVICDDGADIKKVEKND